MGRDMALALGSATANGSTLIGLNQFGGDSTTLRYLPRREHAAGEQVNHPRAKLPEVRQTAAVLGCQATGSWGLSHGCNEHGLFVGRTAWHSRIAGANDATRAVDGNDLVRLVLERGQSACQALDLLTEAIERHGQSGPDGDSVFLVADGREAFVVEAAANHWGLHVCHSTRAVCNVGLVRQDWHRLSRGLGTMVIERQWWPDDGTKLDFHESLLDPGVDERDGLRRWSKATLMLAQQEGALDSASMRRLLAEHFEQCGDASPKQPDGGPGDAPGMAGELGREPGERSTAAGVERVGIGRRAALLPAGRWRAVAAGSARRTGDVDAPDAAPSASEPIRRRPFAIGSRRHSTRRPNRRCSNLHAGSDISMRDRTG